MRPDMSGVCFHRLGDEKRTGAPGKAALEETPSVDTFQEIVEISAASLVESRNQDGKFGTYELFPVNTFHHNDATVRCCPLTKTYIRQNYFHVNDGKRKIFRRLKKSTLRKFFIFEHLRVHYFHNIEKKIIY